MGRALYRKYRSKSLDEIVGQDHIVDILKRAIAQNRVSHAYLLTGPRGVGKTSVARILAHAINGLEYSDDATHLDIIEIDAASNNGVEDVRDLREKVRLAPVSAAKKVYIIDEVHMLSKPAFNALLKTLEEPPAHVVFILATTDVDKLPATVISRTQRYSFRAISHDDAIKQLRFIADAENITIDDDALALIAQRGEGSFRDSISLLDQLASLADTKEGVTAALIEEVLGLAPHALIASLIEAVDKHRLDDVVAQLDSAQRAGIDALVLSKQLIAALRTDIATHPEFLPLIDALLDTGRSSQPELKLLSILGSASIDHTVKPQPKTAALAVAVKEVSASVASLTQKKPVAKTRAKVARAPQPDPSPEASTLAQGADDGSLEGFSWDDLVAYTKEHAVALFSVLGKCTPQIDGNALTIYTHNAFYKKKLDDIKYLSTLYTAIASLGDYHPSVHTIPTAPPPKDSQAAAVAAIMGGGEEVSLDASTT